MKKLTLGLLLSACATSAMADSGFSAEVLLGKADQETKFGPSALIGGTSGDDTSFGLRGAYQFNNYVGVELAYHNYGEASSSYLFDGFTMNDKFSATAINAGAKGGYTFPIGIAVFGRLGLSLWDLEVEETDSEFPDEVFKADDSGVSIYYGIGAQYAFKSGFLVGLEYTITKMDLEIADDYFDLDFDLDHEVKNLSLSIGYRF